MENFRGEKKDDTIAEIKNPRGEKKTADSLVYWLGCNGRSLIQT